MTTSIQARLTLLRPGFSLDVALDLPGQGVTAIVGASGSGKTTLLRCIAGLERARGDVRVHGELWQDASTFLPTWRRELGHVFQEPSLFPHLTVRGNLDYGMARASAPPYADRGRIIALLGIDTLLERRPDGLSGGERQRVAIARALLTGPRLLLMDEPLASLDLTRKQEILPYLERLRDELKMPMLYVSHAPDEVARLADHLVVLEAGRAVATGELGDVLARTDSPFRLGDDAGVVLSGKIAERDAHWHLSRVECANVSFWARDGGLDVGRRVRIRILARDVSIALSAPADSSILNILPATVIEIAPEAHPAQSIIKLGIGPQSLLSRITARSAEHLDLRVGAKVYAQVKAIALIA